MKEPVEEHRKEVEQRVQIAITQGGWEGTHTDFKRQFGDLRPDYVKLVRHVLAFANTPRRTDAYIIFGVDEKKEEGRFDHVGVDGFPSSERLEDILRQHTTLSNVLVDSHFILDGKRTPYIVIPLQFEGPHFLTRDTYGNHERQEVFCRFGSSSSRATERDVLRMKSDWSSWFLDSRYEKTTTSLMNLLSKHFSSISAMSDVGAYVRLVYDSTITDEFGPHHAPVLVHAYSGFDPVSPIAVDQIREEQIHAFGRTIIGQRFSAETRARAAQFAVRCVALDEIYFVNDPYAVLCREFLRKWEEDRVRERLGIIVDLDYRCARDGKALEIKHSILAFLEDELKTPGRRAVIVHGDFGCGKTTTARQLVANLANEYLRGDIAVPKVMYVNVNNIDIRARRDECIESQLSRTKISSGQIDALVQMVRDGDIHLIFDGVDEMGKAYTPEGRQSGLELLRDIGNATASIYLVRSSYYPKLEEMCSDFALVAEHVFETRKRNLMIAEIRGLRPDQVHAYLESRLGFDEASKLRGQLSKLKLESFLSDPLIIHTLATLVDQQGAKGIQTFRGSGEKARFLEFIVHKLLSREQEKRIRHGGLAANFETFQRVLNGVAFGMICRGSSVIVPTQLEAFVYRELDPSERSEAAVNAFRTMSWIQRYDDGSLSFRHDALTQVCAAQYVRSAFEKRGALALALADWQPNAPLASNVADYVGETITNTEMLCATAMLGTESNVNVRQLIASVFASARGRQIDGRVSDTLLDENTIIAVCRGILSDLTLAQLPLEIFLECLGERRRAQIRIPLLWLFSRKEGRESLQMAHYLLKPLMKPGADLADELKRAKKDSSRELDARLLKELSLRASDVLDVVSYEILFKRLTAESIDRPTTQYCDRTIKAIEGEKGRRQAQFHAGAERNPKAK